MSDLAILSLDALDAARAAAISQRALDHALAADAELVVAPIAGDAVLLGAFQRACELGAGIRPLAARGTGGPAVRATDGVLFVHLALARVDALVACDAERLVNRHVRPLLAAIGRVAAPARFFGRDWIAVAHRPAGLVAFAHDATTGRAAFEAFVGVEAPFALGARASFLGKAPGALAELAGKRVQTAHVARAVVDAYAGAWGARVIAGSALDASAPPAPLADEPPWGAAREDAIGLVAAGRDRAGALRVGGEIMASRDAVAALERGLAAGAHELDALAARAFAPPAVLVGARPETIVAALREVLAQ